MSGTTAGVHFEKTGDDLHMRVYRGKTISFEVIWGGSEPIDVTGWRARLQIRDLDGALMLEMSTDNGKCVAGGANGRFAFSGTPEDSRAVDRCGHWELELTTPAGEVYRALSGPVTPVEEIVT